MVRRVRDSLRILSVPDDVYSNAWAHVQAKICARGKIVLGRSDWRNGMNAATTVQLEADGWWASYKVGEDTILGHGETRETALDDLKHQVEDFVHFLTETGQPVPDAFR
jgi:predicted RNase H-like HicB family nuclease